MNERTFAHYARYYDLFYRDKDYAAETTLVDGWLRPDGRPPGSILDVGCGTGGHAREFLRLGWQVCGVDASPEMLDLAREKTPGGDQIAYSSGTAAAFRLDRTFPAIVSLFHVASYHTGPRDLFEMMANLRRHLAPGGLLVFDFWHGPGLLADPPVRRERRIDEGRLKVARISVPVHRPRECVVEVHYEMTVDDPGTGVGGRIAEVHRMRYYFLPELEFILNQAGLVVEFTRAGVSAEPLGDKSWYGLIAARAV